MAENNEGAEKQPEARNPAFERAEEYILKMVLIANSAVERQQEGDRIGMTLALGAVKAGAVIAIGHLRQAETGKITSVNREEIDATLRRLEEERH